MNERSASLNLLKVCILLCTGICLLFALTPLTDFDYDGVPDSFLTDGLLLNFGLPGTVIPVIFMNQSPSAYLAPPRLFTSLVVPPPITI
jgi:hypothetical protein